MPEDQVPIYWDASAILSVLFKDSHSESAIAWAERTEFNFISTLAYAEVCAVIARMKKERILSGPLVAASFETLEQGPWRYLTVVPEWEIIKDLSEKWSLRGGDLWHLATVKSLHKELTELILLTFDVRLQKAAQEEGFILEMPLA